LLAGKGQGAILKDINPVVKNMPNGRSLFRDRIKRGKRGE